MRKDLFNYPSLSIGPWLIYLLSPDLISQVEQDNLWFKETRISSQSKNKMILFCERVSENKEMRGS